MHPDDILYHLNPETMSIKAFIQQDMLLPRLRQTGVLVVYDPDRRYRDLCLELASEHCVAVDASESSIKSRTAALAVLHVPGQADVPLEGLLVYVPTAKPLTDRLNSATPSARTRPAARCLPVATATST